jgi:hypothetical protein
MACCREKQMKYRLPKTWRGAKRLNSHPDPRQIRWSAFSQFGSDRDNSVWYWQMDWIVSYTKQTQFGFSNFLADYIAGHRV